MCMITQITSSKTNGYVIPSYVMYFQTSFPSLGKVQVVCFCPIAVPPKLFRLADNPGPFVSTPALSSDFKATYHFIAYSVTPF